jgi:hypothetical protein
MNDDSATTSATRHDHPGLARRLDQLAESTICDVDAAWDTIQARIAENDTGRPVAG